MSLSAAQWASFWEDGFVVIDAASPAEIAALNARLDDLMSGAVQYGDRLYMQIDPMSGGSPSASSAGSGVDYALYDALATSTAGQTTGFKGPSQAYRKIGEAQAGLEVDPVFLEYMRKPLFRAICDHVYGAHAAISVYRAMVMSKPAGSSGGGTPLPWHQDGGDWWALDRDPLAFVWVALTPATAANGAVQVVRGSHRLGLLSRRGHTLSEADVQRVVGDGSNVVDVTLAPGQAFLCHNFTVHRSGTNTTDAPRRGFSVNYIDARTRVMDPKPAGAGDLGTPGTSFPEVMPSPFA